MSPKNQSAPLCRAGQPRKSRVLANPLRRIQVSGNQSHLRRIQRLLGVGDPPDVVYIRRVRRQRGSETTDVLSASIPFSVLPEAVVSTKPKGLLSFSLRVSCTTVHEL